MYNDLFTHPLTKLLTVVFIMIVGFFVVFIIGFLLALLLFNTSLTELSGFFASYDFSGRMYLLKYFQIIQTIGLFVVPSFVLARMFSNHPATFLGFSRKPRMISLVIVLVLIFTALPFINFLSHLNQSIPFPEYMKSLEEWLMDREKNAQELTFQFLEAKNLMQLVVNIVMIAVLPAIGEELLFRGILQKLFAEWIRNIHLGILIAAVLFSAMHVQFYGFIPRLALGMLLGYLFFWSGSIWLPIIAHFVNNASAVVYYFFQADQLEQSSDHYGSFDMSGIMIVASIAVMIMCCFLVYHYETRMQWPQQQEQD
jgi:uncharacterized protein